VSGGGEGAPSGGGVPGGPGRVIHPHLATGPPAVGGGFDDVAFDGGSDHRSVPFQERGDGEPGGCAGAGRAHNRAGVLGFGGNETAVDGTEGEPPRRWSPHQKGFEVAGFGPFGRFGTAGPLEVFDDPPSGQNETSGG